MNTYKNLKRPVKIKEVNISKQIYKSDKFQNHSTYLEFISQKTKIQITLKERRLNEKRKSRKQKGEYIHRGKMKFDTGLEMEMYQECYIIALDEFKKSRYYLGNKNKKGITIEQIAVTKGKTEDEIKRAIEKN